MSWKKYKKVVVYLFDIKSNKNTLYLTQFQKVIIKTQKSKQKSNQTISNKLQKKINPHLIILFLIN